MKSFVCAAAALALAAGTATAGIFSIGAVDGSDGVVAGGVPGTGLNVAGGSFYQDGFGTAGATGEPNQAFIAIVPSLAFDTYLTIDHSPVLAAPGYGGNNVAAASEAPGSTGFAASSYRGAWFVGGPFVEAVDPAGDDKSWQLFVGRLTYTGTLTGRLAVAIDEGADEVGFTTIVGDLTTEEQAVLGVGVMTQDIEGIPLVKGLDNDGVGGPDGGYAWVTKSFKQVIGTTEYTVTDIYLQNITIVPTPGAMGLLGVAGLAAMRRRR